MPFEGSPRRLVAGRHGGPSIVMSSSEQESQVIRKTLLSLGLAAGLAGGVFFSASSASAATFVPGGVYPSINACAGAGNGGIAAGRWVGWYCQDLTYGQYELWVQPTY
jgi:hypothetical protein